MCEHGGERGVGSSDLHDLVLPVLPSHVSKRCFIASDLVSETSVIDLGVSDPSLGPYVAYSFVSMRVLV